MMKLEQYIAKHPGATDHYKTAYDIISECKVGQTIAVSIDKENRKVFRKYIYDLALKQDKEFATRKRGDSIINVTRIS